MPDGPDFAAATQALSPDELQELHTAVYQVRTGKIPGNFNTDKVNLAWGALNSQVERGAGKPLDKEDWTSGIRQPEPFSKEAFKGLMPGLLGPAGILGKQAYDAVAAGVKGGPMAGLGAAVGVDKEAVEREAALGHTKSVVAMTALPAALAILGGKMAHGFEGGLEHAEAPRPAPVSDSISQAEPTLQTSTPNVMHPAETPAGVEAAKAAPPSPTPGEVAVAPKAVPESAARVAEPINTPARDLKTIIGGISDKDRPSKLPDAELRQVASLEKSDLASTGLKRDDWLAARAEARRRFGGEVKAPAATPQSDIHAGISRLLKASSDEDGDRRSGELMTAIKTADRLPDDAKDSVASSLEQRARVAALQHEEIARVLGAQDYVQGIRDSFANRFVKAGVGAEQVARDPTTGRMEVTPEVDAATGQVKRGGGRTESALSPEERQYAGLILGEKPGRNYALREPTGEPVKVPKLDAAGQAERDAFVKSTQEKLDQHLADVRAQGGVPTEAQKAEGMGLVSAIQETTGKYLAFKGKLPFDIDEQGVVTHPGIDPAQSWWNKIMGRPATSHFAKPDSGAIERRLDQLRDESELANSTAQALRRGIKTPGSETATTPAGQTRSIDAARIETLQKLMPPQAAEAAAPGQSVAELAAAKRGPLDIRPATKEEFLDVASTQRTANLEDLKSMRARLNALESEDKYSATQARLRKSILAYENELQVPHEASAGEMLRVAAKAEPRVRETVTGAPETAHEGRSDELLGLFRQSDEIPKALHAVIEKLHDLTPQDDRDYMAWSAIQNAKGLSQFDLAKRYAGALQLNREGLKAGLGPQALQRGMEFASQGIKKLVKGEEGYVNVPNFIPDVVNELSRYAVNGAVGVKDVVHAMGRFLNEGTYAGVSETSRNAMFKFRGEMNRVEDIGRVAFNQGVDVIRHMSTNDQLNLMADAQRGRPMPTPDLQSQRELLQQLQDKSYAEIQSLRPNIRYWENHIGTFWKKAPNNAAVLYEKHAQIVNKAMLQGDKGMLRRRVFDTVQEGIAAGGVPATTNLFEMGLMDLGRQAQFIHANKELLPALKAQGRLIQGSDKAAQLKAWGFMKNPVRVDDNIVSSWFPVDTASGGTAIAKGEPWFMERGEHEMLKKWLGPDYIRNNVVGKALVGFKNIYTPVELFGPFHAASMVFKSAALGVSQGMNRMFNAGVLQGDLHQAVQGLGEALDGWRAPYKMAREGSDIRKAAGDLMAGKTAFLNSARGQALQKMYPNLPDVIDGLLEGGARLSVNPDYATKWRQSLVQSWMDRKYVKAGVTVPMAGLEQITSQLFQKYIPALKLGAVAREVDVELRRNAEAIQSGEISRSTVLQKAVRRGDNILGELNWDNLNMSKGSRTLLQLAYRSPGWRLGTADLVKNAAWGQVKEAYQAAANRRVPTVDPNFLYLASSAAVGAAASTVFMALFAKKAPSSITDLTNPQTGQVDSRGKAIRLDLPLYTSRDVPEILTNPFSYATGGQTGFISAATEAVKNRTYQGQVLSERQGIGNAAERLAHAALPKPFLLTGHERMTAQGFPSGEAWALNATGLNPSRRDLDMTASERILSNSERVLSGRTAKEMAKRQAIQQIEASFLNRRYDDMAKIQRDKILDQTLTFKEALQATKDAQRPYLTRMAEAVARGGKFDQLIEAYKAGTPDEQRQLSPFLMKNLTKPGVAEKFKEALNGSKP